MALNNDDPFHLAALLWRRGKLIRIGINGREGKVFQRFYSKGTDGQRAYCAHAEMDALLHAKPGDRLEVIRWLKDGTVANAKPCRFCMSWIRRSQISSVRYTNYLGQWERI